VGGQPAIRTPQAASALKVSGGDEEVEVHKKGMIWRELIAEYMGTFLIVWLGCGTVCSAIYTGAQTGLWQIAVVWSIAVTVAISCTSAISGAHLNPAISIAIASLRRGPSFGWGKVLPYCAAQLLGAISAASVNFILYREKIAAFEASSGIVRGAANSIASASAFGEYWR
jgi:glycerol uptake facilitator-like aquaporin